MFMAKELYNPSMLEKEYKDGRYIFKLSPKVTTVWMSQVVMASFFDVSQKVVISAIVTQLKAHSLEKKTHLRTVSYVHQGRAIQETQYSFTIICLVGFLLDSQAAKAFQVWLIGQQERFIKWGLLVDKKRVQVSNERLSYLKRMIAPLFG